ncbi:cAMP-binding protein [Methylophaga frappieri]|jgi:CRP-like cAMP-binding protein|uniref:cAMP-binding protein n=1 Tax=Methylophaga frappieri (strain ATCC BAA-2434 / DSM 25690 / JAM7) TaxID=754477 RepID=I1YEC0_METFJ|nr:Crp/Fnr family transcriptional regulator [Methylophaga frappieri]AFJ01263.1 cAMP-binding protein [Methylophaga frappieri]
MKLEQYPSHNYLLAALTEEERKRVFPNLELVKLPLGEVLHSPDKQIKHVYFPTTAMVSLLHLTESGASTEIAVVGKEGIVGISLFLGGETTSSWALVQSEGFAYKLTGKLLKKEFFRAGKLQRLLLRYTQSLITQMAQTAVCNRHHTVDQQLCRWLLLSLDRLPSNELTMTQELISNMLGVRREGVTEAACSLQRDGLIRYVRGKITVLDREGLENRVCECYQIVKVETDRLMKYNEVQ